MISAGKPEPSPTLATLTPTKPTRNFGLDVIRAAAI